MADGINNRLRKARKKRGKSQTYIADCIGISQPRISKFERGESIPSEYLVLIADLLDVSTDYLLCRTDEAVGGTCITLSDDEYGWIMLLRSLTPEQRDFLDGIKTGISDKLKKKRKK